MGIDNMRAMAVKRSACRIVLVVSCFDQPCEMVKAWPNENRHAVLGCRISWLDRDHASQLGWDKNLGIGFWGTGLWGFGFLGNRVIQVGDRPFAAVFGNLLALPTGWVLLLVHNLSQSR